MNAILYIKKYGNVSNDFQASAIANGLKAWECDEAELVKRVKLYRKWRPKTDKKNMLPTSQAFDLARAGIDPDDVPERQIDLFDKSASLEKSIKENADVWKELAQ